MSDMERLNNTNMEMEVSKKEKSEKTEEVTAGKRPLLAREHWESRKFRWAQVRLSNFIEEDSIEDYVEFT